MSDNERKDQEEPKIIIDEDWKSQVEAERDAAESEPTDQAGAETERTMPPANLELLAHSMAAQAVVSLGIAPDPMTGKAQVDLPTAKFHVDMLAVLEEKTAGNRTPDEEKVLSEALHELRMLYVTVSKSPEQFGSQDDGGEESGPSIVTP